MRARDAAGRDVSRLRRFTILPAIELMVSAETFDFERALDHYRLAEKVAPYVDKIRYNPGHLYHHERDKPARDKVAYIVGVARDHDCAVRIGVNCGCRERLFLLRYGQSAAACGRSAVRYGNRSARRDHDGHRVLVPG